MRYFEDFVPGEVVEFGVTKTVTREEIIAFAQEYDPQFLHLDEAAAAEGPLGGLVASGWHTCGILMRMICDSFLLDTAGLGSPGIERVRWLCPVRPDDRLTGRYQVREARRSSSKPEMGIAVIDYALRNQHDETVLTWACTHLFQCRHPQFAGEGETAS